MVNWKNINRGDVNLNTYELINKILLLNKDEIYKKDIIEIFNIENKIVKSNISNKSTAKYDGFFVYFMLDASSNILYIGKTMNIANRLWIHFNKNHIEFADWKYEVTNIKVMCYNNSEDMSYMESFYIKRDNPRYNKDRPSNDGLNFVAEIRYFNISVSTHYDKIKFFIGDEEYKKDKHKAPLKDTVLSCLEDYIKSYSYKQVVELDTFLIERGFFQSIDEMMNFVQDSLLEINKLTLSLGFEFKIKEEIRPYLIKIDRVKIDKETLLRYDNSRGKFLYKLVETVETGLKEIKIKDFKVKYEIKDTTFSSNFSKFESILKDFGVYRVGNSFLFI